MSVNMGKNMNKENKYTRKTVALGLSLATTLVMMSTSAYAQVTTATVRGSISVEDVKSIQGAEVKAKNIRSGYVSLGKINANGSYVLSGLVPGTYDISYIIDGHLVQTRRVIMQVGQQIDLDVSLVTYDELEEVVVTANRGSAYSLKTSEIGTNVSREQIRNLPQNNRNFLNFAKLAPGITLSNDPQRQQFSSGALGASQTNYFIDGVNMKNNLNGGGGIGQDSSRGSPFSQLAVEGFRVVTQNFKAEYEQAGSAIITAITRSGGNEFEFEAFGIYQDKGLIEQDRFAKERGDEKADFERKQFGGAVGGPIIKDKLHFFVSYEGNRQTNTSNVLLGGSANDDDRARFGNLEGSFSTPFKEDLFFGKLNYQLDENQRMELSVNYRNESDTREVGGINSTDQARDIVNDSISALFKHTYAFDNGALNEFSVSYLDSDWAEKPQNTSNKLVYEGVIITGGHTFSQVASQDSITVRNDYTLPLVDWNGEHLIKVGIKFADYNYLQNKLDHNNPAFLFRKDGNGDFRDRPDEVRFAPGRAELASGNQQIGIFIQDDWEVNEKLTVNLGVRYDIETNAFNKDFVTPDHLVKTLRAIEDLTHDQAALQTFLENKFAANSWMRSLGVALDNGITANSLAFFDAERYITDGTKRKTYKNAIQPRVGFSYDVFEDQSTVLFAGAGRYVDRTLFNFATDETVRFLNPQFNVRFSDDGAPGTVLWDEKFFDPAELSALIDAGTARPEMLLMPNDLEPVISDQFNVGIRQKIGIFQTSVTFSYVKSDNDVSYHFVNMLQERPTLDWWQFLLEGVDPDAQVGNILVADNDRKSRSKSVFVTIDKPFTEEEGWGMSFAYTWSKAENKGEVFNIDFSSAPNTPWGDLTNNARHRLVATGIYALPFDMKISGVFSYSSGERYETFKIDFDNFDPYDFKSPGAGKKKSYAPLDLRLTKDIDIGGSSLTLVAEVFNLFNSENIDSVANWDVPWADDFGEEKSIHRGSTRRFQFGAYYKF